MRRRTFVIGEEGGCSRQALIDPAVVVELDGKRMQRVDNVIEVSAPAVMQRLCAARDRARAECDRARKECDALKSRVARNCARRKNGEPSDLEEEQMEAMAKAVRALEAEQREAERLVGLHDYSPPDGLVMVCCDGVEQVQPGDLYDPETGAFTRPDPEPEVPSMATRLAALEAAIDAMEAQQRPPR